MLLSYREVRAGREPYEIDCERQGECFVEVVDAPNEAPFGIPPSTKVLDVEIPDGKDLRSACQVPSMLVPELHPTVERCSQQWKRTLHHGSVLHLEILRDDLGLLTEP